MLRRITTSSLLAVMLAAPAAAQTPATDSGAGEQTSAFQQLDKQTREIKADMLDLEAELSALEEDIHYPAATRWTVFVTAEPADALSLENVDLSVDGHTVASHRYTADQREALQAGGAHRLYIGNLSPGRHKVAAAFNDGGKSQTAFTLDKPRGPRLLELHWQPAAGGSPAIHRSYADSP